MAALKDCYVVDEENGARIVAAFETSDECEKYIAELESTERDKVHRGGFGIDVPEHKQ